MEEKPSSPLSSLIDKTWMLNPFKAIGSILRVYVMLEKVYFRQGKWSWLTYPVCLPDHKLLGYMVYLAIQGPTFHLPGESTSGRIEE